jgi:hypothetical protein
MAKRIRTFRSIAVEQFQEIRPKLSGGNHKFSDARLKSPFLTNR